MTKKQQPLDQLKQFLEEKGLAVPVIGILVCLAIGFFGGILIITGSSDEKAVAQAAPVPTITVQAEPSPAVTEVATVAPDECITALSNADRGFALSAKLAHEYQLAIKGIQASNGHAIRAAAHDIRDINTKLENLAPKYIANKTACQSVVTD